MGKIVVKALKSGVRNGHDGQIIVFDPESDQERAAYPVIDEKDLKRFADEGLCEKTNRKAPALRGIKTVGEDLSERVAEVPASEDDGGVLDRPGVSSQSTVSVTAWPEGSPALIGAGPDDNEAGDGLSANDADAPPAAGKAPAPAPAKVETKVEGSDGSGQESGDAGAGEGDIAGSGAADTGTGADTGTSGGFDLSKTVPELAEDIKASSDKDKLLAARKAEEDDKNRTGAIKAIDERIAELDAG